MSDAPERIGLVSNGLGQWALATLDESDVAVHYIRADLVAAKDARIAELEDQLASVLQREAATAFRHDDRIAELERQLAEAREVKPLEWFGKPGDFYMFADTDSGLYEIGVEYDDEWFCDFTSHRTGKPIRLSNCQDGPTLPQSAAQADYAARILSALKGAKP